MRIKEITNYLESWAPLALQESYDNSGYIVGNGDSECTGVIVCLDCTEEVIEEAEIKNCNLIIAHHPIIFSGIKKLTGKNYVERTVIKAIQKNIVIYAIHTNLDNCTDGVNAEIADRLGLINSEILLPKSGELLQLGFYVPSQDAEHVKESLFNEGAGSIGNYEECAFELNGTGSFKPTALAKPISGEVGVRNQVEETYIQMILPRWKEQNILLKLKEVHPYEEVAYHFIPLNNRLQIYGSGRIGKLPNAMTVEEFLTLVKSKFNTGTIKFTGKLDKRVLNVAICGGSGQFLTQTAMQKGADLFLTSDIKYHEFFDGENNMTLADMGHFESEQFTIELIIRKITQKFLTFAVHKTGVITNPVRYF